MKLTELICSNNSDTCSDESQTGSGRGSKTIPGRIARPAENAGRRKNAGRLSIAAVILLVLVPVVSVAQGRDAALATVCEKLTTSTVRVVSGADTSSGVIFTADGLVLTVAHGLHREPEVVTVIFYDGTTSEAKVLHQDKDADVAVLRIQNISTSHQFMPLEIASSSSAKKGTGVLAAGYPGREKNGRTPVLRLGELLAVDAGTQRSSCTLTAGDSGGPMVNFQGQLIGLHQQIGLTAESNHHISMDLIADKLKDSTDMSKLLVQAPDNSPALPHQLPAISEDASKKCCTRTVEIFLGEGSQRVALGTVLDQDHVATKLSELVPAMLIRCRSNSGDDTKAVILNADVAMDIAILKLETSLPSTTSIGINTKEENGPLYSIVFAAIGENSVSRQGLVTRVNSSEPGQTGKLGAVLEYADSEKVVRVKDVAPNSTASVG